MVVGVRQLDVEQLVELIDRERPVDAHGVLVDALDRLLLDVELVGDLADDLLEQVLERDDALHRPVLVHHDLHVLVRAPELGQQLDEARRARASRNLLTKLDP